mmetsp:Transcript_9990/g.42146  ORF Transcript_9990/g.42146 Transcript_9990/m.42146 type:complete len:120 (-) Transcript_9990:2326-2685(-)
MGRGRGIIVLVVVFVCLLGVAYGGGHNRRNLGGFSRGVKQRSRVQRWSGNYANTNRKGLSYRAQIPARKMKMKTKYYKTEMTNLKRHLRTRRATRGLSLRILKAFNNFRRRSGRASFVA